MLGVTFIIALSPYCHFRSILRAFEKKKFRFWYYKSKILGLRLKKA